MGRGRGMVMGVVVLLVFGGCGSADDGGGAGTVPATVAVTTTPGAVTTEPVTTTTTHAPTTTGGAVTTTTVTPTGPVLPDAQSLSSVSWDDVGPGDFLAVMTTGEVTGLALVTEDGTIYELARWPEDARERSVLDVDIDGRRALIGIGRQVGVGRASLGAVSLLDLTTGSEHQVFAAPIPTDDGTPWPAPLAAFDPAGGDLVLVTWTDGVTDRIERFDLAGDSAGLLAEQAAELSDPLAWMPDPGGDGLVIGGLDGLRLTDLDGSAHARLDTPGLHCRPLRAWSDHEVLVRCTVDWDGPYFQRLWLLSLDGSAASPLTGLIEWGDNDGCGGECGYRDAWPWGDEVVAQWWAYDGVAEIRRIAAGGAGVKLDVGSDPGSPGSPGSADFLIAVEGHRLAVLTRPPGAISGFSFFGWVDESERTPLLPAIEGHGVVQVVPIG